MRRNLVVGNWKMHGSAELVNELVSGVAQGVAGAAAEAGVCPVSVHLPQALQRAQGSELAVGAQNCSQHEQGAFTGEVSAAMLAELGCRLVILGHSERRQFFGETDDLVAEKAAAARAAGLVPILCVGESLEEREQGHAEAVVTRQLAALVSALEATDVVAYEPVWAIGTGKTATPEQAQEMHACIREYLREHVCEQADQIRLLYGGSVKADNAAELFAQEDIDGGLVGGASLKVADFVAIVKASEE